MKFCKRCGIETERYPHKKRITGDCIPCGRASSRKRAAANPEKNRDRADKWRKANPERTRANSRAWENGNPARKLKKKLRERERLGLPQATRPSPDFCECCGKLPAVVALHLDHCHTTGRFRGWLCASCNLGIGSLGDNVEGVKRALAYLLAA